MAMRDPGTPGRNPLFGAEPGPDEPTGRERAEAGAGRDPGAPPPWGAPDVDALGTIVGLVDALTQAQPEAAEHLVAAAHEVVLAVKTVVDAAESALARQRAAMAAAPRDDRARPAPDDPPSSVHRIDLG